MKRVQKWATTGMVAMSAFTLAGCTITLPQLSQNADQPTITVTQEEQEKYLNFAGDVTGQVLSLTAAFLQIASDFVQDPQNIEAFTKAVSTTLTTFSEGVSTAIEQQRNIEVPPELKGVHSELNDTLTNYETGIADVQEGIETGNVFKITGGVLKIQQAQGDMEALQTELGL